MVALYIFRDSERDAGRTLVKKWQSQSDVIIEQPPIGHS